MPETTPGPDLREQIAEALRTSVDSQIIAEWICCEPIRADHEMCSKADATRQMAQTLLTDDPDWYPARSPVLDAVLAVVQSELDRRDAELRQLRTLVDKAEQTLPIEQRRLLSISRMVFDHIAEGRPVLTREEAADLAQRIVDEIGHSVTEEPALGPTFRVEIDQLKATIDRVRAVHHLKEWVSLSDPCGRHHWFRTYGPTAENIAVADVCPDCRPRRYMNCVCANDECPVLAAIDQPSP